MAVGLAGNREKRKIYTVTGEESKVKHFLLLESCARLRV
jgi:hypothetical protein